MHIVPSCIPGADQINSFFRAWTTEQNKNWLNFYAKRKINQSFFRFNIYDVILTIIMSAEQIEIWSRDADDTNFIVMKKTTNEKTCMLFEDNQWNT